VQIGRGLSLVRFGKLKRLRPFGHGGDDLIGAEPQVDRFGEKAVERFVESLASSTGAELVVRLGHEGAQALARVQDAVAF